MKSLHLFNVVILPAYLAITLVIGWFARRRGVTTNEYLNASRSLPLPIVTAAYLAANCGALEIIGLSAAAAQYGVQALQFYYIGAIPAMIFLALWMMPVYRRSGVRSVPAYLQARYNERVRLLNACVLAVTVLLLGGISLYAMAQVLQVVVGLPFFAGTLLSAGTVLLYVYLGGVRATIYNEVFQLLIILAGLVPLFVKTLRYAAPGVMGEGFRGHLWSGMPLQNHGKPFDVFGMTFGLGFVLSFGYWCTNFVLMQRAFAARSESEARQVPLWAGFGKLLFSFLVVVPGLAATRFLPQIGHGVRFDQSLPRLMTALYSPALLGLGLTALAASLMSGLAANVSAFAALWTEDIYRAALHRDSSERHYLLVGRAAVVAAIVFSLLASFMSFYFNGIMEHVQLLFSVFGAPFWAIFLLGMLSRRITAQGALWGFAGGIACGFLHYELVATHRLHYGSAMNANFYRASFSFLTAVGIASLISWLKHGDVPAQADVLTFQWSVAWRGKQVVRLWVLALLLLSACVALNVYWR